MRKKEEEVRRKEEEREQLDALHQSKVHELQQSILNSSKNA